MANETERKIVELVVNGQAAQSSMKEVAGEVRKLTAEFRKMKEADDPEAYKKKAEEIRALRAEYQRMGEQLRPVSSSISQVNKAIDGMSGPIGAAIKGTKELGVQFLKLLANPIVALIAGITAALTLLFKAFTRTDEGGNKFAAIMEQISAVVDVVMQRLATFAAGVVALFAGNWGEAAGKFKEYKCHTGAQDDAKYRKHQRCGKPHGGVGQNFLHDRRGDLGAHELPRRQRDRALGFRVAVDLLRAQALPRLLRRRLRFLAHDRHKTVSHRPQK